MIHSVRDPSAEDLVERVRSLEIQNTQLRTALKSRIAIEQAKGCVSVRCAVPVDVAFEMIRGLARSQSRGIHELAAEIVANGGSFRAERRQKLDRASNPVQVSGAIHADN